MSFDCMLPLNSRTLLFKQILPPYRLQKTLKCGEGSMTLLFVDLQDYMSCWFVIRHFYKLIYNESTQVYLDEGDSLTRNLFKCIVFLMLFKTSCPSAERMLRNHNMQHSHQVPDQPVITIPQKQVPTSTETGQTGQRSLIRELTLTH